MTSTEQYNTVVTEARSALEKSMEIWKESAKAMSEKADFTAFMPKVDLAAAVDQYFQLANQTMDASKDLTGKWAAAMTSLFDVMQQQAEAWGTLMHDQASKVSSMATEQTEKFESAIKKSVDKAA